MFPSLSKRLLVPPGDGNDALPSEAIASASKRPATIVAFGRPTPVYSFSKRTHETFEDTDVLSGCGAAVPRAPFESIQL